MITLKEFNSRFKWVDDGKLDSWQILSGVGPLEGDCDDYAVTASYIESGSLTRMWWNLITLKHVHWFVWDDRDQSHLALWVKGKGWIDNQYPAYYKELRHKKRYPVLLPMVILKMFIGKFVK